MISKSEEDMMKVRNLGRKSLDEVVAKLQSLGFSLSTMRIKGGNFNARFQKIGQTY